MNHVILNFKYGARNAGDVLEEIGREILPQLAAFQPGPHRTQGLPPAAARSD